MKAGTLDLMKFKRLKRRLSESDRGTAGILELLWQRTGKNAPRGDIGKFTNEEIAVMCDYEGSADSLVAALTETGWLDSSDDHRLVVHDWHEHAPNYVKGVVSRQGGFVTQGQQPKVSDSGSTTQSTPTIPNLPLPNLTPPPLTETETAAWRQVEAVLLEHGVGQAKHAVKIVVAAGCKPTEVHDLICFWNLRRPAWGPGALHDRLLIFQPSQDYTSLWPGESEVAKEKIRREKQPIYKASPRQTEAEREASAAAFADELAKVALQPSRSDSPCISKAEEEVSGD